MASVEELTQKLLNPMQALYRVPYGIQDHERALSEYARALIGLPGHLLDAAWSRLVASHKRRDWPSVSEILEAAGSVTPRAEPAVGVGDGVHESRMSHASSLRDFPFVSSPLRSDPRWGQFLDRIHLSAEHAWFAQAEPVGDGIEVPNAFRREQIISRFGEALSAHFGQMVPVNVNPARTYANLP